VRLILVGVFQDSEKDGVFTALSKQTLKNRFVFRLRTNWDRGPKFAGARPASAPGPRVDAETTGTQRRPSSGFRDPDLSRTCRGSTVASKNAGIQRFQTHTLGRRGHTVVDRGPRDDLPPRDRVMVKDPLIDFEEVVVFIRSLGSIPRPVGRPRDGSSDYGPLVVIYALVRLAVLLAGKTKLEHPGSRCLSPVSTK
jgi:hypothetical protein